MAGPSNTTPIVSARFPWSEGVYPAIRLTGEQLAATECFNIEWPGSGVQPLASEQELVRLHLAVEHPTDFIMVPTPAMVTALAHHRTVDWESVRAILVDLTETMMHHLKLTVTHRRAAYLVEKKKSPEQQAADAQAAVEAAQAAVAAAAGEQYQGDSDSDDELWDDNDLAGNPANAAAGGGAGGGGQGAGGPGPPGGGPNDNDVEMASVHSEARARDTNALLAKAINRLSKTAVQQSKINARAQARLDEPAHQKEVVAAVRWTYWGIEDRGHPDYLSPTLFLNECNQRRTRFRYSNRDTVEFFKMSLRGPASNWYAGIEAVNRDRTRICIDDWDGLQMAFRQHHGIGGKLFHVDFKQILTNLKDEPVGTYIARVREALDKYYAHHGDKIYLESWPRQKKLLKIGEAKAAGDKVYNSFAFPADVAGRATNIVEAILQAVPEDVRDDLRDAVQPVMSTVEQHFEEGCYTYLKQFIKESKPDFLFFAKTRYEWFECISFMEDTKLKEYALTNSRQAFAKDELMSTISLYDLIEQKQRSITKPQKHAPPPNIAQVCRLDAGQRANLLQQLANYSNEFDEVDMAALRAGAAPPGAAGGAGRGRGRGRGRGVPRGGRRARGGRQGELGADLAPQVPRDPNKFCVVCQIPGHDVVACRKRSKFGWDGYRLVQPSDHPRIPGMVAAIGMEAASAVAGTEQQQQSQQQSQQQPQQQQQRGTTSGSPPAAGQEAQGTEVWRPPAMQTTFDR